MNLRTYYSHIYALSFINRYSNIPRVRNEDVAQHSFFVAAIILKLHDDYVFDLGLALQAAISHDITEADLTDVTHRIKLDNPSLAREIKIAELKEVKKYPEAVAKGYEVFENSETVEGLIANYADVLQVQQYVESEAGLGNPSMTRIEHETRKRLAQMREELKFHERSRNDTESTN